MLVAARQIDTSTSDPPTELHSKDLQRKSIPTTDADTGRSIQTAEQSGLAPQGLV